MKQQSDKVAATVLRYDELIGRVLASLPATLLAPDDEEKQVPASALKFYKNGSGASPAQQRKEDSKRGKRLKYDLDAQENKNEEKKATTQLPAGDPTTVEELRERLREKLDAAKAGRTTTKKRKLDQAPKERAPKKSPQGTKKKETKKRIVVEKEQQGERVGADVSFPMLKPRKESTGGRAGAPGSKTRRLKALAAGAEQKREELNRLKEIGDDTADRIEWKEAMQLASGEMKARVDPAKIKKALKSRQKKKEKSKKAWDERIEQQQKQMALPKKEKRKLDREKHHKKERKKTDEQDKPKKRRKPSSGSSAHR